MTHRTFACLLALALVNVAPRAAVAADAAYHHMHLTATTPEEGAQWYIKHMDCQAVPGRPERAKCGPIAQRPAAVAGHAERAERRQRRESHRVLVHQS